MAPRPARPETRDEIIRVGTDLVGRAGYAATGLDSILKGAGVPKGSFYYYFPSKEDFGLAVIDAFAAEYDRKLDRIFGDERASPLQRLRNYLQSGIEAHANESCRRGCLIGTLGQEMAGQHERFRERLDAVLAGWERRFADCLRAAVDAGELTRDADPEQLARYLLAGWEGALLRAKVTRSPRPLQDFYDVTFARVLTRAGNQPEGAPR